MGLRFPSGILFLKSTSNINRATGQLVKTEKIVSSGKAVQTLSDDPAASTRIIAINREILDNDRFLSTISSGKALLDSAASALTSISDLVSRAKEIAIQGANQTLNQQDRDVLADEVDGLLNQALGIANQQVNGRYLFSGTKSDVTPYSIDTISGETYAKYHGNNGSLGLLINFGVSLGVTLPGPKVFQEPGYTGTTFKGSTGAAVGSGKDTGQGNDTLKITHGLTTYSGATGISAGNSSAASDTVIGLAGTHTMTIDNAAKTLSLDGGPTVSYAGGLSGPDVKVTNANGDFVFVNTTGISASGTVNITSTGYLSTDNGASPPVLINYSSNQKVVDSVTGALTNVNTTNIVRTGNEYITYKGTFDIFSEFKNLRDDLRNTRNLSSGDQLQSLQDRISQIDGVRGVVLTGISIFGERSNQLQGAEERIQTVQGDVKQLLSSVQDADLAQAITDFTRAQSSLEAAQAIASRVLSISLLNFLK